MMVKYEEWIDRWKGILIFLVVLGHVIGGFYHITTEDIKPSLQVFYKGIYFFHMPAFFFIAGFSFRDTSSHLQYVQKKFYRLIVPYFVFGVLSVCIYMAVGMFVETFLVANSTTSYYEQNSAATDWWGAIVSLLHAGGWPNGLGFRFNSVLWFLPCMFSTMLIFKCLHHFGGFALMFATGLAVAMDILNLMPESLPWGLSYVPKYIFYVVLGNLFSNTTCRMMLDSKNRNGQICCAVALFLAVFISAYFTPDPMIMRCKILGSISLYLLGCAGCVGSMLLAKVATWRFWVCLGWTSLGIMVMHKFIIVGLVVKAPFMRVAVSHSTIVALVVSIVLSLIVATVCFAITIPMKKFAPLMLGEKRGGQ